MLVILNFIFGIFASCIIVFQKQITAKYVIYLFFFASFFFMPKQPQRKCHINISIFLPTNVCGFINFSIIFVAIYFTARKEHHNVLRCLAFFIFSAFFGGRFSFNLCLFSSIVHWCSRISRSRNKWIRLWYMTAYSKREMKNGEAKWKDHIIENCIGFSFFFFFYKSQRRVRRRRPLWPPSFLYPLIENQLKYVECN